MNRNRKTQKKKNDDSTVKAILLVTAIINLINAIVSLVKAFI